MNLQQRPGRRPFGIKFGICAATTIFFIMTASSARPADKAVIKVVLNTEDAGEHFVLLSEGDVLLPEADLLEMGLAGLPEGTLIGDTRYISLKSLSPAITYRYDDKGATLILDAAPALFKRNIIDLANKRPEGAIAARSNSAFLNYSLTYNADDKFGFASISLPWDAGARLGDYFLYSSFNYSKNLLSENSVRLMTNVTRDFPQSQARLMLGDVGAASGGLGGGATLGGVSVSKNFTMTPYFKKTMGLDIPGAVRTPSEARVYVNGQLVSTQKFAPGEFVILDVPQATGRGNAELVIKDASGKEERYALPFYITSALLKPGIQEYGYSAGVKRKDLGTQSYTYEGGAITGYHRLGVTRGVTAGVRAEADNEVFNFGPELSMLAGGSGEINAQAAYSSAKGVTGYAGTLAYSYTSLAGLTARASGRHYSKSYSTVSAAPSSDKARLDWTVGLGFNDTANAVSGSYSKKYNYIAAPSSRASLYYTRKLGQYTSVYATLNAVSADRKRSSDIFAGYNILLGEKASGGVSTDYGRDKSTVAAFLQESPGNGEGFGYRLFTERAAQKATETEKAANFINGSGSGVYRGAWGVYTLDARRQSDAMNYGMNLSGALSFINSSFYLSRPINDSFALVKVGSVESVAVSVSNQELGRTNRNGEALVPEFASWYDNTVSVDDATIPLNYTLKEVSKYVSTPHRGGAIVEFGAAKVQGFGAKVFWTQKGVKKTAEYAGIEITGPKGVIDGIIGKGGEMYLENLPAGRFPARVFMKDKDCRFEMNVPKSDDMIVDMGDIICETH
ncbi:MAG: fimbrial biogenesis outer membrane usher protein [Deltaproteobacteria bacterium]|nr:fimbrial biogenesis outer membrane usher protein [Deltaproteobacteria bacterium]